jgi:hypothetical protein
MKTTAALLMCGVLALGLAGCSGMSISTDFDPAAVPAMAAYRTYSWLEQPGGKDVRVSNDLVNSRVISAVDREMLANGYERDMSGAPDFLVGYHIDLEGKLDVDTIDSYYGYGYRAWQTETYVRQYVEGTLILDVVDAESNDLVWRGQAQAEVDAQPDPEARTARINEAVRQILAKFPPK